MRIDDIARLADATGAAGDFEPIGFSIDSRTVRPNDLFIAIRGEFFDGHDFVKTAFEKGACAALIHRDVPGLADDEATRCLRVDDTLAALQRLARRLLAAWGRPVVGITGSMGKTTTKELTARLLGLCGRVHASIGNLNNGYGLPLTVLRMISDGKRMEDFDIAVLEMGMNHAGEIELLCSIAPPDVAVVLNVAPVHIENFADGIEGVAAAKAEIVRGLKSGGLAVLNADDRRVSRMAAICIEKRDGHSGSQVVYFGRNEAAHVTALDVRPNGLLGTEFTLSTLRGNAKAVLPLPGEHLVTNALAAAAVALHFGASPDAIAAAFSECKPVYHRGETLRFANGVIVVDDTYNSNPRALTEMMRLLADVSGAARRIVVAGEMLELGPDGPSMHFECGKTAVELGIDMVVGVRGLAAELVAGARSAGLPDTAAWFAADATEAGEKLAAVVAPGDVVLVKGSRGVRTELAIEVLKQRFPLE